jgi:hypothetical protein
MRKSKHHLLRSFISAFKTILLVCAANILSVSCGRKSDIATQLTAQSTNLLAVSRTAITSKADIQRFLVPGLPTNIIVSRLGFPWWNETWNDGDRPRLTWWYNITPFPAGDTMPGYDIVGISIDITNGCLAKWGCNYRKPEQPPVVGKTIPIAERGRENNSNGSRLPVLKLFILSTNTPTGGRFINTKEFPNLGYIPSLPIIAINKVMDLSLEEAIISDSGTQSHKRWIFYIHLTSTDAPLFQAVTTDNFGRLMLVTIDDKPLFPVFISDPIGTGILRIEITNEATMEMAKEQLAKMVREGQ